MRPVPRTVHRHATVRECTRASSGERVLCVRTALACDLKRDRKGPKVQGLVAAAELDQLMRHAAREDGHQLGALHDGLCRAVLQRPPRRLVHRGRRRRARPLARRLVVPAAALEDGIEHVEPAPELAHLEREHADHCLVPACVRARMHAGVGS